MQVANDLTEHLKGIGGCPMADDELVGNMNSELMIKYFEEQNMLPCIE